MIPDIRYLRPLSLDEALDALARSKDSIKVLAGGTDIIPGFLQNSARFREINTLLDVSSLPDLHQISAEDRHIKIGAAVTFSQLQNDLTIKNYLPLLSDMAGTVGSVQIRNRATIGGNFINNAPCADSVPVLLVYEARVHIQSVKQTYDIALEDFLRKPYFTRLQPGELVTHISLSIPSDDFRGEFYKLGRRQAVNISRISLAILINTTSGIIHDLRIASGAITPVGKRLHEIENDARGKSASDEMIRELSVHAGKLVLEISGLRWSSAYKLPVLQQMCYQMLYRLTNSSSETQIDP